MGLLIELFDAPCISKNKSRTGNSLPSNSSLTKNDGINKATQFWIATSFVGGWQPNLENSNEFMPNN